MNWKAFLVVLLGIPLAIALVIGWAYMIQAAAENGGVWAGTATLFGPIVIACALIVGLTFRGAEKPEIHPVNMSIRELADSEED